MKSVLAAVCRPKRRKSTLFLALLLILALPAAVLAHPMGNFTISRYSELFLSDEEANLYYVVDMAEIPTFQETEIIDTDGNGEVTQAELESYLDIQLPILQENLLLTVDGQAAEWTLNERAIELGQGDGELKILRIDLRFSAPLPADPSEAWQASFVDNNFAERLGWQEVVVNSADGTTLLESTAPTASISDALRAYPEEAQLEVNNAEFSFGPAAIVGTVSGVSNEIIETGESSGGIMNFLEEDRFAELINSSLSNPWTVFLVFLAAFGWGAAHALTPGHGKTIVAAYLVGSRGTIKHAVFLGLTTTLTHTAGVFTIGLITLFASRYILPEQLFPWLGVASGLLVVIIGFSLLRGGVSGLLGRAEVPEDDNSHDHEFSGDYLVHSHGGGPAHAHLPPSALGDGQISMKNLFALGVSGGLIPCPSALILMLSAIALGRIGFGVVLIVIFSLGLAGVLTAIGVLWVKATEVLNRLDGENSIFSRIPGRQYLGQVLPAASAAFIMVAGLLITFQALTETGII